MSDASRYQDLRGTGLTESQVRCRVEDGRLVRPFHDVYRDPGHVDRYADLRALFVRLPPGSVACRETAAALHGFADFVPRPRGVHIIVPPGAWPARIRAVKSHEAVLPFETVVAHGIPCTTAARTAVDLARGFRRLDALPVLDGALRIGVAPDDLAAEVARHARLRGICQVRALVTKADAGAQCRQESQIRLVVLDGGLPRPTTQYAVVDAFGRTRYYLDLAWEEFSVAAEYDGRSHDARVQHDRERHNWLEGRGWMMRYFTAIDLYRRPRHIVSILRAAMER